MDQTLRSDTAMLLIVSQPLVSVIYFVFDTSINLHFFIMSFCIQVDLCVTSVERKANFSVVLFGLISGQLDAVGSTIQPNCSFRILCLFSECQNARMCNQGWALDEARQISQHCGPSLRCG